MTDASVWQGDAASSAGPADETANQHDPGEQVNARRGHYGHAGLHVARTVCGKPLDARSDIYSLGVIAYQMLAGEPPFAGVTGNVMQEHINVRRHTCGNETRKFATRGSSSYDRAFETARGSSAIRRGLCRVRCAARQKALARFTGARSRFTANTFPSF